VEELVDQLFDLFDSMGEDEGSTGGDGIITTLEFKQCLDKFNAGLTDEEVFIRARKFNADGVCDYLAFTYLSLCVSSRGAAVLFLFRFISNFQSICFAISVIFMINPVNTLFAQVAMLLAELDEDCSGTIDKKEFKEMLEKYATEE